MTGGSRRAWNAILTATAVLGFGYAALGGLGYLTLFELFSLLPEPTAHPRAAQPPRPLPDLRRVVVAPRAPLRDPEVPEPGPVRRLSGTSGGAVPAPAGTGAAAAAELPRPALAAAGRVLAPGTAWSDREAAAEELANAGDGRPASGRRHRRDRSARAGAPSGLALEAAEVSAGREASEVTPDGLEPNDGQLQESEPELADFLRNEQRLVSGERAGRSRRSASPTAAVAVEDPETALRSAAEFDQQGVISGPDFPAEAFDDLVGGASERR